MCAADCSVQVGPTMVGNISASMEWLVNSPSPRANPLWNLRCIWLMGMWSTVRVWRVLSTPMARVMGCSQHRSERAGPSGHGHGSLGLHLGPVHSLGDNMVVVHALSTGTAKDTLLMHQLRCLHFFTAQFQIGLQACKWIPQPSGRCILPQFIASVSCLHSTGCQGAHSHSSRAE